VVKTFISQIAGPYINHITKKLNVLIVRLKIAQVIRDMIDKNLNSKLNVLIVGLKTRKKG